MAALKQRARPFRRASSLSNLVCRPRYYGDTNLAPKKFDVRIIFFRLGRLQTLLLKNHNILCAKWAVFPCPVKYVLFHYCTRLCMLGADVDVLVHKEDNVFQGISFQDEGMKQVFVSYPELLCIDATYKLLEVRCPLYILLVEDGNGQSEVAAGFLLMEENEQSLSCVIENFKQKNPQWEHTRVLMQIKI